MIITLTTDFGAGSPYVAALKGVLLSINPAATLVDLSHGIPPQDVRGGALFLAQVTRWFPPGTIHLAVVDPGVGTDRAVLCASWRQQLYVAPDNGLLSGLIRGPTAPGEVYRIERPEQFLPNVSPTFHGRDIMGPIAARLSLGLQPEEVGGRVHQIVELDWAEPVVTDHAVSGIVEQVDSFGNLITNIGQQHLVQLPPGGRIQVSCCSQSIGRLSAVYADVPKGSLLALISSSGHLEIALSGGSAERALGATIGDPVIVTWLETEKP